MSMRSRADKPPKVIRRLDYCLSVWTFMGKRVTTGLQQQQCKLEVNSNNMHANRFQNRIFISCLGLIKWVLHLILFKATVLIQNYKEVS